MKRTSARIAIATALTASIGMGGAAAVQAAPKPVTVKSAKAVKAAKSDRRTQVEIRLVAAYKRNALREITRKDIALTLAKSRVVKANVGATETAAVTANITADKTVLDGYKASVNAARTRTDVQAIERAVYAFRVENYDQVRGLLASQNRAVTKVGAVNRAITDVTAQVEALEAAGKDMTKARAALASATTKAAAAAAALEAVDTKVLAIRATTPRLGSESVFRAATRSLTSTNLTVLAAQKSVETARALVASA